jgi:hypothetical protein
VFSQSDSYRNFVKSVFYLFTGCVLCEYVIANLDAILEDKKNEAKIKAALESVCNIMPATVSSLGLFAASFLLVPLQSHARNSKFFGPFCSIIPSGSVCNIMPATVKFLGSVCSIIPSGSVCSLMPATVGS